MEGGNTQADAGWARLREEVARRINAQPLPWEAKVEILKGCGASVPEDE